jgi:hypothetical protein
VVVVISALPIVGGWFGFLVALFGFGALLLTLAPRDRTPTVDDPPAEPA